MRGYKRKYGPKTYSDEVHKFALKHIGLTFTVASDRSGPKGDCYRDIDDLSQEAYIGMLSAAADVVSGKLPESEFSRIASSRMQSRVNRTANRTYASISIPWYVIARNWIERRKGNECSLPKSDEVNLEHVTYDEDSDWAGSLVEEALARMEPEDAELLRQWYGIGRIQRTVHDAVAETGMTRESSYKPVRAAREKLRPILEELMQTEYGRL